MMFEFTDNHFAYGTFRFVFLDRPYRVPWLNTRHFLMFALACKR